MRDAIIDGQKNGKPRTIVITNNNGFKMRVEQDGQIATIDLTNDDVYELHSKWYDYIITQKTLGKSTLIQVEERDRLKAKAKKYDELAEKIGKFYPDDDSETGDLCDIGEVVAMHFGFLV